MKHKTECCNCRCKYHQHNDTCGTVAKIGLNAKCLSFEKGLLYYFDLVWQALHAQNWINTVELTDDLRIGLYCVMTAYHLGVCEMEWGLCRMVGLKSGEDGPLLNTDDILAMPIDTEQFQKLMQDFEAGTLPRPEQQPLPAKSSQSYGWLSPAGEFVEADFGEHNDAAQRIIRKKGVGKEFRSWSLTHTGTCRDFLSDVKGYCLIHDPSGSGGYLVSSTKPLTKKQRDFLYGYFLEIGDHFKAEQYIDAEM